MAKELGLKNHQVDIIEDIVRKPEDYRMEVGDKIELKNVGFNEWEISIVHKSNRRTETTVYNDFQERRDTKRAKRIKSKYDSLESRYIDPLDLDMLNWDTPLFVDYERLKEKERKVKQPKLHSSTQSDETKGTETEKLSD